MNYRSRFVIDLHEQRPLDVSVTSFSETMNVRYCFLSKRSHGTLEETAVTEVTEQIMNSLSGLFIATGSDREAVTDYRNLAALVLHE